MTKMTPLIGRNEQFAKSYDPGTFGLPAAQVVVVVCLDHRADPAIVLRLELGDAPVIRNAGGPYATVKADVERLLTAPLLSPKVSVSGHVYDIATGRVTTAVDARYP